MKRIGAMVMLITVALSCLCASAQTPEPADSLKKQRDLTVSLITCYPGPEVYELCGHEAVRVRGEGIDSVWNFGIFDFNQPNFIYRFVKGETDYKCAAYPFQWFLPEYQARGSKVVEQDLNFTPEEAERMLTILREAAAPENATYRYNYTKDNCATRILTKIDKASDEEIIYPDSVRYGTFRNEMRAYHEGYPWYQFGIDLALGSGLDQTVNTREEMFVPVEMMKNAAGAKFSDGRPLVKETRVLNEGVGSAVLPPTSWYWGPLFWSWLIAVLVIAVVVFGVRQNRIFMPLYAVWYFILGLAGCLVAFLVFISVHEATSPNILILWLNPFQFLFAIAVLVRNLRILANIMAWYNFLVIGVLLIISPFLTQSFNAAFYPLMLSTFALGLGYLITEKRRKKEIE